ncbi:toll/interleukin-1 receptor domain-containing protein [Lentzea cavernae]|nr:toll/interleukin-1 receptor domain-containing protein [Lentzea cavernae]
MLWDFFVSCSETDRSWAEWIAFHLERAGHDVRVEVRDLAPGHNRVHRLDEAVRLSRRTVVVLSPAYLADAELAAEWHSAWDADPAGVRRTLIPVRVANCRPGGLLGDLRCIDLVGLDGARAAAKLITGIDGTRPGGGDRPGLFPR